MKQSQWSWTHTALHPVLQFARPSHQPRHCWTVCRDSADPASAAFIYISFDQALSAMSVLSISISYFITYPFFILFLLFTPPVSDVETIKAVEVREGVVGALLFLFTLPSSAVSAPHILYSSYITFQSSAYMSLFTSEISQSSLTCFYQVL